MTDNRFTRRAALAGVAASAASCASGPRREAFTTAARATNAAFAHGVASGDPAPNSVVLWTRISTYETGTISVDWELAEDPEFARIVVYGRAETNGRRDHTVKVIPDRLEPGTTYYYRFKSGSSVSPVGRTRTLPVGAVDRLKFAVMSCSNYPFGYFNAYDHIARRDDLDAVIHLGDYIYEYGPDGYGGEVGARIGREHAPAREILTLADYRERHAQYKSDAGSLAMLAAHPLIALWDDHETANNTWADGAQNHQESEGSWDARLAAAMQAYYEWMPVREPRAGRTREDLYRAFEFGDLLTLATIETRLTARSLQLEYQEIVPQLTSPEAVARFEREVLGADDRMMLGAEQERFLEDTLNASTAAGKPWRMIANQIIMAEVRSPDLNPYVTEDQIAEIEKDWDGIRAFLEFSKLGLPLNLDAWDGYPAARERFFRLARNADARDLLVVTGDTHNWWANDLTAKDGSKMGVELGTTAVSSPGAGQFLGGKGREFGMLLNQKNPSMRYYSVENRGYIALEITPEKARADYVAVSTVESPIYEAFVQASFDIRKKDGSLEFAGARGLSRAEEALYKYDLSERDLTFFERIGLLV